MRDPVLKVLPQLGRDKVDAYKEAESVDEIDELAAPLERAWAPTKHISLTATMRLLDEVQERPEFKSDPVASDAWLASRLHATLRLTPREAGTSGIWSYLALTGARDYVDWRWSESATADRFVGGVNKQALARLWWAAELLRDGLTYGRLLPFFARQDFPNSILHRSFARNRPLFKLVVDRLVARAFVAGEPSADEINDVADAVNIVTLPKVVGLYATERRDATSYRHWVLEAPNVWPDRPVGPADLFDDGCTPQVSAFVDSILDSQQIGTMPNLDRRRHRRARRRTELAERVAPGN